MNGELKSEGTYELFTTPGGKEVLNFDNIAYYSLSEGEGEGYIYSLDRA